MALPNTTGTGSGEGLSPGDRVGGARYLLKRLLGRGVASEVWLAQDVTGARPVALKIFPRAFLADANLVEQLKQQVQRHLLLKHPHVAMIYEFVRDANTMAMAMEYVDGWSLASLKVDKLFKCYRVEEIEGWVGQLCEALEFAHNDLGIVHSDLKPANLIVNAQEALKVTDFEIAAIIRKEASRRGLSKGLYGGLGFLSPQQVMGELPSKLDDIYSLGATIFDLLTGTPPFYKGEVFAQICSLKAPSMTERIKELEIQDDPISLVWEDTVARCLAKNPADRPQSVAEVRELLKRESVAKPAAAPSVVPEEVKAKAAEIKAADPESPTSIIASETPKETETTPAVSPAPLAPASAPLVAPPPSRSQLPLIVGGFVVLMAVLCVAGVIGYTSLKHDLTSKTQSPGGTNSATALVAGSPGSVDTSFNTGDGAAGEVRTLLIQPDGKIIVAGKFDIFNGAAHRNIVRLNSDGSVDDSFKHQGWGIIRGVGLQASGRIIIVGDAVAKGRPRNHILRMTDNGEVDKSFSQGPKISGALGAVAIQPNDDIVVGGSFTQLNNKPQQHLMRFLADGQPDDDFDANIFSDAAVWALASQPDGKILAGGAFTRFNDVDAGHLVRLNANGTLDPSFNTGKGADGVVMSIALEKDGAVVIGGAFNNVNGRPCAHIARLNVDGTVDTTFATDAGADKNVRSVAIQPDGKILVAGEFMNFGNTPCHHIARLNPDGSLDKTFNTGSGASSIIDCAAVQPDGKILIGGSLTGFNGNAYGGIVRLNGSAPGH